jgi:hypothetical protein
LFLNFELLADLQQAEKALDRLKKIAKSGEKEAKANVAAMEGIIEQFNSGRPARLQDIPETLLRDYQFLTAKPILYVANTDEGEPDMDLLKPLQDRAASEGAGFIHLCTKIEAEILELPEEDRAMYYEEAGITSPGLARLAKAGQDLLNLICFFTAGEQEARAWLVENDVKAPQAAGKIHSDMERGFIRAEVYNYQDLADLGSYKAVQEKGRVRLEGKDYPVSEGDVIYFRFSV